LFEKWNAYWHDFFHKDPYDNFHKYLHYAIIDLLLIPYYHWFYDFRVVGRENVPLKKPFLIVSNHYSYNDPTLISLALGVEIAYIAKKELFSDEKLKGYVKFLGGIPIDREKTGASTLKQIKSAFSHNWAVAIFIEGTRNQSREFMSNVAPGAAYIAKFGGNLDVLPVGIEDGQKKGDRFIVRIGEPIPYDPNLSFEELALKYGKAVAKLANLKLILPESHETGVSSHSG
jgi:1-acyl-sn-glycerol-3-phosphate acyltransferase